MTARHGIVCNAVAPGKIVTGKPGPAASAEALALSLSWEWATREGGGPDEVQGP